MLSSEAKMLGDSIFFLLKSIGSIKYRIFAAHWNRASCARSSLYKNMSKHTSSALTSSPLTANDDQLRTSSGIMRALAHPLRMRMIAVIDSKPTAEACVNEIFDALQIEQSVASQHLRILRQAELVQTRRDGKFIYYSLNYNRLNKARGSASTFSGFVNAG